MSSIVIKGNTSGQVEIAAPDVAGSTTLTLPTGSANILTSESTLSSSKLSGALPALDGSALTGVSAGKVLQVVYGESSAVTSWAAGATWKDFGVSATITPSSTSSKILVIADVNYGFSIAGVAHSARLLRDSTLIYGGASGSYIQGFQATEGSIGGRNYETHKLTASTVDSPSSTSALTYKVQHYQHSAAGTVYLNRTDANQAGVHAQTRSSIILMEIAG